MSKNDQWLCVFIVTWPMLLAGFFASAKPAFAPNYSNVIPDKIVTPGVVRADATKEKVCDPTWEHKSRHVTVTMKKHVAASYHLDWASHGDYEFDHLIPVCLGGASVEANLWPQAYEPRPGAHEKDQVEDKLCRDLCSGRIKSLADAQKLIQSGWLDLYNKMQAQEQRKTLKQRN